MSDEHQDPLDVLPEDAAVVDRIVDGTHAVLLVGEEEIELTVGVALLPEGTGEGDWLRLSLAPDVALSEQRREALESRVERLRRTRGGGRFS